ncbi:hypothetical protein [Leifsonia aquatica]|uniref:hypothetical protein n=1 Tax=Leifsonia aquatica TaxID=144185 RepID=UPI0038121C95
MSKVSLEHAQSMVDRYQAAIARHPAPSTKVSPRQQTELSNLAYWRAVLERLNESTE